MNGAPARWELGVRRVGSGGGALGVAATFSSRNDCFMAFFSAFSRGFREDTRFFGADLGATWCARRVFGLESRVEMADIEDLKLCRELPSGSDRGSSSDDSDDSRSAMVLMGF